MKVIVIGGMGTIGRPVADALAASHGRKWLILPGIVTAFLFQHAVQGWCPPVPF
jgi:hypothetical protein